MFYIYRFYSEIILDNKYLAFSKGEFYDMKYSSWFNFAIIYSEGKFPKNYNAYQSKFHKMKQIC